MGSTDPEAIADELGNLSAAKETIFFLSLLFLQTDFPFELRIVDDDVDAIIAWKCILEGAIFHRMSGNTALPKLKTNTPLGNEEDSTIA